jgi:hypothetical protein
LPDASRTIIGTLIIFVSAAIAVSFRIAVLPLADVVSDILAFSHLAESDVLGLLDRIGRTALVQFIGHA